MTDRLKALIETWAPRIAAAFLRSVKGIRDQVRIADLVRMITAGDVEGALRAVGLEPARFRLLDQTLTGYYEAGGVEASRFIPTLNASPLGVRIGPLFDVRAPATDAWIRQHNTDLIAQITEEQRALVRQAPTPLRNVAGDPLLTGDTPQKLALDLVGRVSRVTGSREGGILGLTSQQAEWARNYAAEIAQTPPSADALTRTLRDRRFDRTVAKAIREGRAIPDDLQATMLATYRNRTLRYRAETIAKAEADAVAIQSQQEAWDQAVARGVIDTTKVRRFWLTAGDDRVRPTHAAVPEMNADGVGLHEPFNTPKGPALQPGWAFDPGCRCRVRVRIAESV